MNPNIAPCIKVKLRSSIDKKAIVNPSNVAGIILNKMAGLPICFIWFILIPNPPINNTVTKAISLIYGDISKVGWGIIFKNDGPINIPNKIIPIRGGSFIS